MCLVTDRASARVSIFPTIRQAGESDLSQIHSLQEASILALVEPAYNSTIAAVWTRWQVCNAARLLSEGKFFLADDGQCSVAVGGWTPHATERDSAWVRSVFVAPNRVRLGLGRLILSAIERSAADAARHRLHLNASLNSIHFYSALGYSEHDHWQWEPERGVNIELARMCKR
jgi:GNAT superfamily N-acetyltransferase